MIVFILSLYGNMQARENPLFWHTLRSDKFRKIFWKCMFHITNLTKLRKLKMNFFSKYFNNGKKVARDKKAGLDYNA